MGMAALANLAEPNLREGREKPLRLALSALCRVGEFSQRLEFAAGPSVRNCRLETQPRHLSKPSRGLTAGFSMNCLRSTEARRTGIGVAILNETNTKIGFPGWPEHNLDCVPVLGGQLAEGACTGPLFYFRSLF